MIIYEDTLPPDPPSRESRRATLDGFIWPVCRPDMVEPRTIIDRMAEDCLGLFQSEGTILAQSLKRLGWTRAQIARHADAAQEAFIRRRAARRRIAGRQTGAAA